MSLSFHRTDCLVLTIYSAFAESDTAEFLQARAKKK